MAPALQILSGTKTPAALTLALLEGNDLGAKQSPIIRQFQANFLRLPRPGRTQPLDGQGQGGHPNRRHLVELGRIERVQDPLRLPNQPPVCRAREPERPKAGPAIRAASRREPRSSTPAPRPAARSWSASRSPRRTCARPPTGNSSSADGSTSVDECHYPDTGSVDWVKHDTEVFDYSYDDARELVSVDGPDRTRCSGATIWVGGLRRWRRTRRRRRRPTTRWVMWRRRRWMCRRVWISPRRWSATRVRRPHPIQGGQPAPRDQRGW